MSAVSVGNVLPLITPSVITGDFIQTKNLTNALNAGNRSEQTPTSLPTGEFTLGRNLIGVENVGNVFHRALACVIIRVFTPG